MARNVPEGIVGFNALKTIISVIKTKLVPEGTNNDNGKVLTKTIDGFEWKNTTTMTGATKTTAGAVGIVPAPIAGQNSAFLRGDGTWATLVPQRISYVATEGQTSFNIPFSYDANSSNLSVYFNGLLMKETDNYTVTIEQQGDEYFGTINLAGFAAEAGDIVIIMGIIGAANVDFNQEAINAINQINTTVSTATTTIDNTVSTANTNITNTISTATTNFNQLVQQTNDDIDNKINELNTFIDELPDDVATLANKSYVDNKISALATVATSGSYNDLSNKPTIPQGTVTSVSVKMNGAVKGTVTSSGTIDLGTISTKVWQSGSSAPSDTNLLWIDTNTTTGGLKYYNGSSWVHVPTAWG